MSKSFRNVPGSKNKSSSSSFISLHFNKADEEQLEISYGDKADDNDESLEIEDTISEPSVSRNTSTFFGSNKDVTGSEDPLLVSGDATSTHDKFDSRDSNRDSVVKDYWSRLSKRAYSLDSDLGILSGKNSDQNEGWKVFKDLKGKITKTLEERKSGSKSFIRDDRTTSPDETKKEESDPDLTPTEKQKVLQLSPAIEAPEVKNEMSPFEDYINDELDKAKCEIFSTKPKISPSNTSFSLHPPKKTVKSDSSKTLTSKVENKHPILEKKLNTDTAKSDTETLQSSDNKFSKLKVLIRNYVYFVKTYWKNVIFRILVVILGLLIAPIPSWISGFLSGAFLAGLFVYFLYKPGTPKKAFTVPDFGQLSPANIHVTEVEDEIYKGWMNELPFEINYNPDTYHVNCTRSLYVRLDGSYLRVSYPQNNIPKRAMFNERRHEMQFVHQQHYDITGATVELLPQGLARKRLWSKKYPLCLRIPNPKQAVLSSTGKSVPEPSPISKTATGRRESPLKKMVPRINENNEVVLYLFSRTDREKDLWYIRFKKASRIKLLRSHSPSSSPNIAALEASLSLENKRTISLDLASLQSCNDLDSPSDSELDIDGFSEITMTKHQKFELYMNHLLSPLHLDHSLIARDKPESKAVLTWLNVLIGRVFFDFLTEDVWGKLVAERIQRKLSKIKLPVFLKELKVKDIYLGTALPKIHRASEPTLDQRGLWIDIDLSYNGSFQMTLETKINLMRLKYGMEEFSIPDAAKGMGSMDQELRSPVYNSDEEDSADTSSDEEMPLPEVNDLSSIDGSAMSTAGGSAGKKILRFVDKIAQSTYFQNATKNKYIKKAMEDISNTPLVLTVEVQWLTGTLALNIPPMPTDRLWYGFRTNPHLSIVARPKLGQHVVTFSHVTEWIEKKLVSEFQKILVMPNMDDLIIPIMKSDPDLL